MLGGSHRVSAKMAQSGIRSNAPLLAMSAMTEDWTPPPRLMTVRDGSGFIMPPPRWCHRWAGRPQGASPPGVKYPSSVAYLTSRDRRRRCLSLASGPGLEKTLMTPISKASPRGFRRPFCSLFPVVSFMLRSRSGGWWAAGLSTRDCGWAAGADGTGERGGIQPSQAPPCRRCVCARRSRFSSCAP